MLANAGAHARKILINNNESRYFYAKCTTENGKNTFMHKNATKMNYFSKKC